MNTKMIVRKRDFVQRKPRTVNFIKPIITINENPLSKDLKQFIFYTYDLDMYMLICMNEFGEVVDIFSTFDPKLNRTNLRYKFVKTVETLISIITKNNPICLYMNDGTLFTPANYQIMAKTKIEYCSASMIYDLIQSIQQQLLKKKRHNYKCPSYKTIKKLAPDMTRAEYESIYL